MESLFIYFWAFLFGWIGSLFGTTGLVIGGFLGLTAGILIWAALSSNKNQKEKEHKPTIKNSTGKVKTNNLNQNVVNKVESNNIDRKSLIQKK